MANVKKKKLTIGSVVDGIQKIDHSFINGRNAKWYIHFGMQFDNFVGT